MNKGGFSLRRLLGISAFKSRISRAIGIPLTKSGRRCSFLGASMKGGMHHEKNEVEICEAGDCEV